MIQYIEGKMLRDMFVSGANNLQNHKDLVDKLNVFPVPDGDTGTNMSLTISYAMKELAKVENDNITEIGKSLSKGSLMGARGNSGVILSQIIRGIAKSIEGKENLNVVDLANALNEKLKAINPSLSRGVLQKDNAGANGIYNQDFNPNTILIEVGGQYNYIAEVNNSLKVFANVLHDYLKGELWKKRKIGF